jgi:hypothetical protein
LVPLTRNSFRKDVAGLMRFVGRWIARALDWLGSDISTWKVLFVLAGGAIVGFLVLFADFHWWDDQHRDVAGTGPYVLWAGLMIAQTALWALALGWLLPPLLQLWAKYGKDKETRAEVVRSTKMLVAMVSVFTVAGLVGRKLPNYFWGHTVKVLLLTVLGVIVGLIAAVGIWLVRGGLRQLAALATQELATKRALHTFLGLQADLQRFLGTLGAILGLLILSTGAQRLAVLSYSDDTEYGYGLVLVYGFFFSILVAAVYVPTHLTLTSVGNGIRDAFFPELLPTPEHWPEADRETPEAPATEHRDTWDERTAKREKLGAMLGLQVGPLSQFKASAAILTPFIGSLTALLLK